MDGKQLIKERGPQSNSRSNPSCVFFRPNIIIKTISLRKIIREISGRCSERVSYKSLSRSIVICNYTILFCFWGFSASALDKWKRTKGKIEARRILAPDWQMNFCFEAKWVIEGEKKFKGPVKPSLLCNLLFQSVYKIKYELSFILLIDDCISPTLLTAKKIQIRKMN